MCTPVTPAVLYLLLGLQDVQWAVGNSRGARKLARTPRVNKKKKKEVHGGKTENKDLYIVFVSHQSVPGKLKEKENAMIFFLFPFHFTRGKSLVQLKLINYRLDN
jgi:hypothetical protein